MSVTDWSTDKTTVLNYLDNLRKSIEDAEGCLFQVEEEGIWEEVTHEGKPDLVYLGSHSIIGFKLANWKPE
jgi:hypothetical protein